MKVLFVFFAMLLGWGVVYGGEFGLPVLIYCSNSDGDVLCLSHPHRPDRNIIDHDDYDYDLHVLENHDELVREGIVSYDGYKSQHSPGKWYFSYFDKKGHRQLVVHVMDAHKDQSDRRVQLGFATVSEANDFTKPTHSYDRCTVILSE